MFQNRVDKYLIITLAIPLLYCCYYLIQGEFLLKGNSDMIDLNVPYFMAVNDAVKTDIIPSWTRFTFTGFPLIGSPTLLWYPPNWIAFIVPKYYVPHVMTMLAWLHFIGLAGVAFIYFREISKSSYWASVSAVTYTFSLPVIYGLTCMVSYLPAYMFTLLALYTIHTAPNRVWNLNVVYIALITFAIITGGFIQIVFYSIFLICLYSIFIGIYGTENTHTKDKKIILYCLGGIIIGVILAFPMLLPFLMLSVDTSKDYIGMSPSKIYEAFKTTPILLWRLFSPNAFGFSISLPNTEMGGINYLESMNAFCGVIMLFLAGYAVTISRSPVVIFWLSIFLGIILIAMTPLAYLHIFAFGGKPILYNRITFLLPIAITAMAVIAGQHIDSKNHILMRNVFINPFWVLLLIAAASGIPTGYYMWIEVVMGVLLIFVLVLCGVLLWKKNKYLCHFIIFSLVLLEVVRSGHLMTKVQNYPLMVKSRDYYTYGNPDKSFQLSEDDLKQYRIVLSNVINASDSKAPYGAMEANQGIVYGYMSPWGYNNAYSSRLFFLNKTVCNECVSDRMVSFNKGMPSFDKLADLTSVGYILNPYPKWHIVEDRRKTALPRASLFYEYESTNVEHINLEQKGLFGYWKFDNNAEDSSGYNNHGRWVGKEQYNNGILGKAAFVNGYSYITVSHSPSMDVGKEAFSFGAWVNFIGKKDGKNQHFLNKRTGGKGIFWDMYLSSEGSNINSEIAGRSYDNPPSGMLPNTWHHIFLIRDSFGFVAVYIDGKLIKNKYMPGDSSNTHSFNIGNLEGSLEQGFIGLIDEVVIYNRALTMKEVIKIYSSYLNFYDEKKATIQKLITDNIFKDPNFPIRQKVVLTSGYKHPIGPADPNSYVKFIKNANSHIILESETRTPAILLLTDVLTNGWTAYIDGKQTDIMEGNIAFRAIYVPPGKHEVEFKYFPPGLWLSLLFSLIGISVCIVLYKLPK